MSYLLSQRRTGIGPIDNYLYSKRNIVFELKLDAGAGKTLTGSAHSTPFAAKLDTPVKLEVRFNAKLP